VRCTFRKSETQKIPDAFREFHRQCVAVAHLSTLSRTRTGRQVLENRPKHGLIEYLAEGPLSRSARVYGSPQSFRVTSHLNAAFTASNALTRPPPYHLLWPLRSYLAGIIARFTFSIEFLFFFMSEHCASVRVLRGPVRFSLIRLFAGTAFVCFSE